MAKYVPYQASYDELIKLDKLSKIIIYVSTGFAIIIAVLNQFKCTGAPNDGWCVLEDVPKFITYVNCGFIVLYAAFELYVKRTFYNVRYTKRLDLIDDSYGSTFLDENSVEYYTNSELSPGIYKLAVNCFESSFFTYANAKHMWAPLVTKGLGVILVFFIVIFSGDKWIVEFFQLSLPLILIGEGIKHYQFREDVKKNLEAFQTLFHTIKVKGVAGADAEFMKLIFNYETTISSAAIVLDPDFYNNNNDELTKKWNQMKERYNIPQLQKAAQS